METIQINFQALVMLCTLFVQNESHMNGHHIFVGPSPPFSRYSDFFFFTHKGGHLSKSFSKAHFMLRVTVELPGHVKRLWKNEA